MLFRSATGIFSTVRVAGEGVALAVVGAALSMLIARRIEAADLTGRIVPAAQRLAGGDLGGALPFLPTADAGRLTALYGAAFGRLLVALAAITALTALVVFLSLGMGESGTAAASGPGRERHREGGLDGDAPRSA